MNGLFFLAQSPALERGLDLGEPGSILAFIVIALVAGTAAVAAVTRARYEKKRVGRNFLVGLLGAFLGAFIFGLLDIDLPDILAWPITIADILVAFVGAALLMFLLRSIR